MRIQPKALFAAASLSIALSFGVQDSGKQEQDDASLFPADIAERELARLHDEIEGAWLLISYETFSEYLDEERVRGFATFHDGYATMLFGATETSDRLIGRRYRTLVDSGAYRYRVTPDYRVQFVSIMNLTNMTESGFVEYDAAGLTSEYELRLGDGRLELTNDAGDKRIYRRLEPSEFPQKAIDDLQAESGGWGFDED